MLALHLPEGFRDRRAGDAVIQRAAGDAVAQLDEIRHIHCHIADLHLFFRFRTGRCADVHEQLRHGSVLRAVLFGFKIRYAARAVLKAHLARHGDDRVHAAHVRYAQEAVLVDVHNDEADLIHVRAEHDLLAGSSLLHGDQVAERVVVYFIRKRLHIAADHVADRLLPAGGAVCRQNAFEHILIKHNHNTSSNFLVFRKESASL